MPDQDNTGQDTGKTGPCVKDEIVVDGTTYRIVTPPPVVDPMEPAKKGPDGKPYVVLHLDDFGHRVVGYYDAFYGVVSIEDARFVSGVTSYTLAQKGVSIGVHGIASPPKVLAAIPRFDVMLGRNQLFKVYYATEVARLSIINATIEP